MVIKPTLRNDWEGWNLSKYRIEIIRLDHWLA